MFARVLWHWDVLSLGLISASLQIQQQPINTHSCLTSKCYNPLSMCDVCLHSNWRMKFVESNIWVKHWQINSKMYHGFTVVLRYQFLVMIMERHHYFIMWLWKCMKICSRFRPHYKYKNKIQQFRCSWCHFLSDFCIIKCWQSIKICASNIFKPLVWMLYFFYC